MGQALGLAEFKSIAKGIEMMDTMTKRANISIVENRIVCIGKFFVVVAGEVADVTAAVEAALELSDKDLVGARVIPSLADGVIERINGKIDRTAISALGVVESRNVNSGLYAANYIKKSSNVEILRISMTLGLGGKALVIFTGDIASVRNAIDVASEKVSATDIVSAVAIPSPSQEMIDKFFR